MKRCSNCGTERPLEEFPRAKHTRDGRQSWCRPCHNADVAERNRRNPKRHYERVSRSRKLSPEKVRARDLVYRAIKRGELARPATCPECGVEAKVQAHHKDYSKPLEVEWLCSACHGRLHRAEAAA